MRSRFAKRAVLAFAVLALVSASTAIVAAQTPSPNFVVSASPNSATVLQGTNAQYGVSVTGTNGFKSPVSLAVSGLPSGASAGLTNNPNPLGAQSLLTVSTGPTTGAGDYSLTVTGTSGKLKHTVQVVLTVTKPPTPKFALAVSPTSASVFAGSAASYGVSVTRTNLSAPIAFSVSGLPAHATASFSPTSSAGYATSLLVSTLATTPAGTYPLVIHGASGSITSTVTANLTVQKPPTPKFSVDVDPDNLNVPAGTTGTYVVTIVRTNLTDPIAFTVTGLPGQTTATFAPGSTSGNWATLSVATSVGTPLGSYTLTVKGTSGSVTASGSAHLTVSAAQHKSFAIAGILDRLLSPGATGFLNLALTNPNNQALSVTNLAVTITGTSKSACTVSGNFTTVQFSGSYPLTLPANSTRTLSQLGIPQANWPRVTMVNLPTNQDSCKSTGLTLGYAGTGVGN